MSMTPDAPSTDLGEGADHDKVAQGSPGPDPDPDTGRGNSKRRPKAIKPTACRRCHARKVKCSGGQPCENCRTANRSSECSYPKRNRQVKVSQRYLDELLEEIKHLRSQDGSQSIRSNDAVAAVSIQPSSPTRRDVSGIGDAGVGGGGGGGADTTAKNPTMDVRPWFMNTNMFHTPVLLGEAADAAFATRCRQAISDPQAPQHKHIFRTNYASDERLMTLSDSPCPWPSPSRARFLIEVSLRYVTKSYHVVRRSQVMDAVEQSLSNPVWCDSVIKCKLWALFAIGEVYATRTNPPGRDFPGMAYFAKASRLLGVLSERPTIDSIETINLLSFYSLALNRRYTAYTLAGYAARMAIVMGLHLNIPESQLRDPATREHRIRLWWTTYVFDRMWSSKLGHPFAIQDNDIELSLPSTPAVVSETDAQDFADPAYYTASVKLASLASRIIRTIYARGNQSTSLSNRVQQALKDLRSWVEELPSQLQIDSHARTDVVPSPVTLHLSFNQCAILATRPILLHVLRTQAASWPATTPAAESQVPASAMTLVEACVRCARHSCRLLTECWIEGSFATFDYFYTQYLFSALIVLAASSLINGKESRNDREQFEEAADLLLQLKDGGNYTAQEFYRHVEALRVVMEAAQSKKKGLADAAAIQNPDVMNQSPFSDPAVDQPMGQAFYPPSRMATAGMALAEPSLQELLAQPVLDLQFIDASLYDDYSQGLYWPDFSSEHWTPDSWAAG